MDEPLFPLLCINRLRMGTDGRGITTLIAGQGCPLRCRYCINARLLRDVPAELVSAQTLLERVQVDDLYFQATGGGVTFGGGEPLLHAAFIYRFRKICPSSWHICAETSLAVPKAQIALALECVDDFIVDIKDLDPSAYLRYTGCDARVMKEGLTYLLSHADSTRLHVRVPFIPEYNTREHVDEAVRRLQEMGIEQIEVFDYRIPQLPYSLPESL